MNASPMSSRLFRWVLSSLVVAVSPAMAAPLRSGTLQIQDVWIREAPPQAPVLAGYGVILGGGKPDRLLRVEADEFARVELHEMVPATAGMARMRQLSQLEIPLGATCSLDPGGSHLMLFSPRRQLVAGNFVRMRWYFAEAGLVKVRAKVRRVD
ncbi:MAG: copper chaperone PCu(A)C [Candidatus Sericytochromatia bacterium]|nr:copper chaperone PCu(A)C [Candidatus Sericytochromatia bacterium]